MTKMASQVDAIGFHFRMEHLVENPVAFMSNDFHLFGMDKLPFYSPKQSHVTSFISSHSKNAGRKSNRIQPYGGVFRSHKFNSSFFQAEIPNHAQISPEAGAKESLPLHSSTDLPFVEDTLGALSYGPVSALHVPNKPNKIIQLLHMQVRGPGTRDLLERTLPTLFPLQRWLPRWKHLTLRKLF